MNKNQGVIEFEPIQKQKPLVVGGIYINITDNIDDPYDGMFSLCMGSDQFYFLYDGMNHIENEVEIACAHRMKLVEGYALAINKLKKEWYIRDSGIKGQYRYILATGSYNNGFERSLEPFFKVFMK